MLNPDYSPKVLDPHEVYRFVIAKYSAKPIDLDLRLRNYGSYARLGLSSDGKYKAEEIVDITKDTVIKLKKAIDSSKNVDNSELKAQLTPNEEYSDALYNAQTISIAVPELKPLFEDALIL